MNTITDNTDTYIFSVAETTQEARDWDRSAGDSDRRGTLAEALALSKELDAEIYLTDEPGWDRGVVRPDGGWRLF